MEQSAVFLRSPSDIGKIADFQTEINLTDRINDSSIGNLGNKVKNYINDLMTSWPRVGPPVWFSIPKYHGVHYEKGWGLRFCTDYRQLNNKTTPNRQSIPKVQDILDS